MQALRLTPTLRRVFLVEDAESVAEQVRDWLTPHWKIELLQSSRQLLRRIDYERPDLILLDLTLPRMDGLTTLRWLRSSDVPVIMICPDTLEGARAAMEALLAGAADCFIKKPLRGREQLAITRGQLARRMAQAAAAGGRPAETGHAWHRLEVGPSGCVAAEGPCLDPFPQSPPWVGFALAQTRSAAVLLHAFAQVAGRPPGGMLIGASLPCRFTQALAETATRIWNRPVIELRDGEGLRPGQWRYIPGQHIVVPVPDASLFGCLRVVPHRGTDETGALARQLTLLGRHTPARLRLYLLDPPDARTQEALNGLSAGADAILLHAGAARTRRGEPRRLTNDEVETEDGSTLRRLVA